MIKKILLIVFVVFISSFVYSQQTITFTTTSTVSSWSPSNFTNSGVLPIWEATGSGIATQTVTANLPAFDFSSNDGSDISITCISTDAFAGLTTLYVSDRDLTTLDVSLAINLTSLSYRDNNVSGQVDLSALANLESLWLSNNNLTDLEVSGNSSLTFISAGNNQLPSTVVDKIVNDLDINGLSNGTLRLSGNSPLTMAAQPAYDNLISKGWTIDVQAPILPTIELITFSSTSTVSSWSPSDFSNSGAVPTWEATGSGITTQTVTANLPAFDFSSNDGSDISITCTSTDAFAGLTTLYVSGRDLTAMDVSKAISLTSLSFKDNNISGLIDISTLTNLTSLWFSNNNLTDLDVSGNSSLTFISADNNQLTSLVVDKIINDIDTNGLFNGTLRITGNSPLTMAAQPAYDNLISKGWTIDVSAPIAPSTEVITFTTTSTVSSWSPSDFSNSGAVPTWEATGSGIATQTVTANLPAFDFSSNDGSDILITCTSTDAFAGLTTLYVSDRDLTVMDVSKVINLTSLSFKDNNISGLVDISTLTNLTSIWSSNNNLTDLDVSGNSSLTFISADNNQLTLLVVDKIINDLDTNGLFNGILRIAGNSPLTMAAQPAYDNLIGKGWTIDVQAPIPPTIDVITFSSTSTVSSWSPSDFSNSGAVPTWEATGSGITTQTVTANLPAFDFSSNDGSDILITCTSTDAFAGLTTLYVSDRDLTVMDVSKAINLTSLSFKDNNISGLVDISTLTNLTSIWLSNNNLTDLDVSGNLNLILLSAENNQLTSLVVDKIINDLDTNGLSNGTLRLLGNSPLTSASQPSYDNLITKGWTIDVAAPIAPGPHLKITGNGLDITNSNTAIPEDGTDYLETTLGNPLLNTFIIENFGDQDLTITSPLFSTSADFVITSQPANMVIAAGGSESFEVTFNPTTLGAKSGSVLIQSDDPDASIFVLNLKGEAVNVLSNQIMITQYYEGFGANDRWVEVKNISGQAIPANTYFLALFDQAAARTGIIETAVPTQNTPIPALGVDQTVLFRNTAATLPTAGHIGAAAQTNSNVCTFDGDDVIIISTSNASNSYNQRVEMMGNISPNSSTSPEAWGTNSSFIKGGCSSEEAHKEFDINDWSFLLIVDVDEANSVTNLALGTQAVGPTEFDGTTWSNLIADQSRTVTLTSSFSNANQTISACNLIINNGVNVDFDSDGASTKSIVIYGDLIINGSGSLRVGDTESFVTLDPNATLGEITKIEKSTELFDIHDNTYWSSPVQGQQLNTIFSSVDPTRIFEFKAGDENPLYAGTNYKYWWVASGAMNRGVGYAAEGSDIGVQELTFTGIPYNGSFTTNMFFSGTVDTGDANENFNLIGNPYPTAIDIQRILEDNGSVNEIALWTHATPLGGGVFDPADYVFYNITGSTTPGVTENIGSGQGFMARSVTGGGVIFNNGYKLIDRNDQFYKSANSKKSGIAKEEKDRVWLRLKNGSVKSDILVGFVNGATDGRDLYYDAQGYNNDKSIKLYSLIDGDKFVIQGLEDFATDKTISLGFDSKISGDLTISIAELEGVLRSTDVYLVDKLLNVTHNLKDSDYTFEQNITGSFLDRFTLQFAAGLALDMDDDILAKNGFAISNDFESLKIRSTKTVTDIKVFDLLGRMLIHMKPNEKSFNIGTTTIKNGTVLVVHATLENGTVVSKKTIKY